MRLKNKFTGQVVDDEQAERAYGWYEQFTGWDAPEQFYSEEDWEEINA